MTAPSTPNPTQTSPRRYDIDALRVIATLVLIIFHTGMVFTAFDGWHIQNLERSTFVGRLLGFIGQWHMPLFFLLAGASTYFALNFRSSRQYVGERVKRLFLPLLVGILLVIPPQIYLERIATWIPTRTSPIDFSGSFPAFYLHSFNSLYPEGNISWHHLWFVFYLFAYSLILLPLLLYLRKPGGRAKIARIAAALAGGRKIFWLAFPIALVEIGLRWRFPNWQNFIGDWANHAHYPMIFLFGFLLMADERFRSAVDRNRRTALIIGLLASATRLLGEAGIAGYVLDMGMKGLAEWAFLIAILGYGHRYLNRPSKLLRHSSEIAYPFYIWHQTVIVILAFFVVQLDMSIGAKFALIAVTATLITWLICEVLKLTNVTRFMFGMKAKRRQSSPQKTFVPSGLQPAPAER
ncbi:MAG: acyltransferase [Proteobacteria bacterium]|nr:acyltransferase [Pseudomonadota bacterium]